MPNKVNIHNVRDELRIMLHTLAGLLLNCSFARASKTHRVGAPGYYKTQLLVTENWAQAVRANTAWHVPHRH